MFELEEARSNGGGEMREWEDEAERYERRYMTLEELKVPETDGQIRQAREKPENLSDESAFVYSIELLKTAYEGGMQKQKQCGHLYLKKELT
uniref:Uncharacterized protein n=1 Tax=Ascaris lumbricoides TaxID=6252 RepID=A0A0M3HT08_ASCLU